jgi:hypothetical protein
MWIVMYFFPDSENIKIPEIYGPFSQESIAQVWTEVVQDVKGLKGTFIIAPISDPIMVLSP